MTAAERQELRHYCTPEHRWKLPWWWQQIEALLDRVDELEAENARFRTELEAENKQWIDISRENARLRAVIVRYSKATVALRAATDVALVLDEFDYAEGALLELGAALDGDR